MRIRRTGAVLQLAILMAVLTWFAQTVAEAADAVSFRQPCSTTASGTIRRSRTC
jgi:hypothetical protein